MVGIYKITNPDGEVYIGQSRNIILRWKSHFYCKKLSKTHRLHSSFIIHGIKKHRFEVIEECLVPELNQRERYWQDFYKVLTNGLNMSLQDTLTKKKIYSEELKDILKSSRTLDISGDKNWHYKNMPRHIVEAAITINKTLTGELRYNTKVILNKETGIYYYGLTESCSSVNGLLPKTLSRYLNGERVNKTSFVFA